MACCVSEPAVLAGALPVAVGDLGDDLAALLDGFEDEADVELLAEGGLDADLDVVEVDEDGDVQAILVRQTEFLALCECQERSTVSGRRYPASVRSGRADCLG